MESKVLNRVETTSNIIGLTDEAELWARRDSDPQAREELVSYQLAKYYFRQNKLKEAIPLYEKANIENLSNAEIAEAKFELAYCYFNIKEFKKAQPLFASIKEIPGKYNLPANYYYGFISYYNHQYAEALSSFQKVVNEPKYSNIVPYYIAEIITSSGKRTSSSPTPSPCCGKAVNITKRR